MDWPAPAEFGDRGAPVRFARLPFPVALDVGGDLARAWGEGGTSHRLAFGPGGELLRGVYGSQEDGQTRLEYLLKERAGGGARP